jgi:hypothetical protein
VVSYWFEMVRRPNDRFSWVFVKVDEGRRRVLARGDRDYRYKERAEQVIGVLKTEAGRAEVLDATSATDVFDLPRRSFEIAPYVVPLLIGQPRARHTRANGHRRKPGSPTTPTDRPDHPAAEETAPTEVSSAAPVGRDSGEYAGAAKKAAPTKATRRGAAKKASRGRPAARGSRTR